MIKKIYILVKLFCNTLAVFPSAKRLKGMRLIHSLEAAICTDINKVIMRIEINNAKREKNL